MCAVRILRSRMLGGFVALSLAACLASPSGWAQSKAPAKKPPPIQAKQAILMSFPLGIVLLRKDERAPMAPSSMTKLMTALLVIEAIKSGKTKADAKVTITQAATKTRGSRARLRRGQKVSVQTLLEATLIGSANDAAIALAIHIAGSEDKFAAQMTTRAKEMGLLGSQFRNATGFAAKGHQMTARDVALLSAHIMNRHPQYFALFAKRTTKVGRRRLRNRNPVLGRVKGADGIKTGQTRAGGFGLAASAVRGKVRLILVINGLKSAKARAIEARRLLEWGFKTVVP